MCLHGRKVQRGWGAVTDGTVLTRDRVGPHGPLLVQARAARWNFQDVMAPNWGRTGVLGTVEVGARVHDGPGWKCVSPFFESRPGGRSAPYERHEDVEPPGDEQEVPGEEPADPLQELSHLHRLLRGPKPEFFCSTGHAEERCSEGLTTTAELRWGESLLKHQKHWQQ